MTAAADDLRRTMRGTSANYLAALLQLGLFVFHAIGARLFGKLAYSAYIFAWSIVEIANKIGVAGLDKGTMRAVATERARGDRDAELRALATALRTVCWVSILVMGAVMVLAGPMAAWKGDFAFAPAVRILAAQVLPWAGMMVLINATMATGSMRYNLLVRGLADPIMMLVSLGAVALIWPDGGGAALALAHLSAGAVVLVLAFLAFGRLFDARRVIRRMVSARTDWRLIRFSIPVGLADLLNQAIYRTDVLLIGLLLEDPLQVANYGACILLAASISSVRYAFDPILSPVVAEVVVSRDTTRLANNLKLMVRWVTLLSLPIFLAMVIYGDVLLSLWGESYREAHLALAILACAHMINSCLGLHQWPVVMSGRSKLDLFNNAVAFAVNLVLNLVLIPSWGLPGAAIATLVGNLTFRSMQAIQVWHIFGCHAFSAAWSKLVVSAAAAAGAQVAIRAALGVADWLSFAVATAAGVTAYLVVASLLGLAPEERALMARIVQRFRNQRRE